MSGTIKSAVITFPGSNCDDDCVYALEKIIGFQVDRLWHQDTPELNQYRLVVIPGGFSYGDYLRCGAIASLSPIMKKVKEFADAGGFVIGICNGFQILCEMGLLPGALTRNSSLMFICRDVVLSVTNNSTPWTSRYGSAEKISLPIAHGDGRYIADEDLLKQLESNGQILLKYTDNPNGSVGNIAGICNEKKNVFGLMPHPERASDLKSRDGLKIWESLKAIL